MNADELRALPDAEFLRVWSNLSGKDRGALPAEAQREFVGRTRALTPYVDATITRLERKNLLADSAEGAQGAKPNGEDKSDSHPPKQPATPVPVRLNWRSLASREPPVRTWAIEHWLGFYLTLIAGRGGIGKTLLAQMLGTALALGRDFLDHTSRPLRALLWACEDDHDELWRRQLAINEFFGIGMEAIDGFVVESRIGCENVLFSVEYGRALWTPVYEELREQVNDERIDVLFLDNNGHTYAGNKADEHMVTHYGNGLSGLVLKPVNYET